MFCNLQAVFVQLQATGFVKDIEDVIREFLPDERIGSLGFLLEAAMTMMPVMMMMVMIEIRIGVVGVRFD